MGKRTWNYPLHPVPFDIKQFNEGIENYSDGMVLITETGFQIDANSTIENAIWRTAIWKPF